MCLNKALTKNIHDHKKLNRHQNNKLLFQGNKFMCQFKAKYKTLNEPSEYLAHMI